MINVDLLYPVGSIYLSIKSKNPSEIFGGVWERIANGRTLVGVDENDTDFSSSEKVGGEKKHVLTVKEMPSHSHGANSGATTFADGGINEPSQGSGNRTFTYLSLTSTGGGQPHNNVPPYVTCYIFVRTA